MKKLAPALSILVATSLLAGSLEASAGLLKRPAPAARPAETLEQSRARIERQNTAEEGLIRTRDFGAQLVGHYFVGKAYVPQGLLKPARPVVFEDRRVPELREAMLTVGKSWLEYLDGTEIKTDLARLKPEELDHHRALVSGFHSFLKSDAGEAWFLSTVRSLAESKKLDMNMRLADFFPRVVESYEKDVAPVSAAAVRSVNKAFNHLSWKITERSFKRGTSRVWSFLKRRTTIVLFSSAVIITMNRGYLKTLVHPAHPGGRTATEQAALVRSWHEMRGPLSTMQMEVSRVGSRLQLEMAKAGVRKDASVRAWRAAEAEFRRSGEEFWSRLMGSAELKQIYADRVASELNGSVQDVRDAMEGLSAPGSVDPQARLADARVRVVLAERLAELAVTDLLLVPSSPSTVGGSSRAEASAVLSEGLERLGDMNLFHGKLQEHLEELAKIQKRFAADLDKEFPQAAQ